MPSPLSKSALIESITKLQTDDTSKRQVKSVVEALVTVGHKELKKSGVFLVPGFAKFIVVKKPATKARKGINPFTKEPTVFKAKPARKVVKARPVKAVKDAIA
jgi:DNA-binding protein HU-beta